MFRVGLPDELDDEDLKVLVEALKSGEATLFKYLRERFLQLTLPLSTPLDVVKMRGRNKAMSKPSLGVQ